MSHPERFPKDDLSREADELFMGYKEDVAAKEKEETEEKVREGRILHESLKAFPIVEHLLEYGLLTKDMSVGDALERMKEATKETSAVTYLLEYGLLAKDMTVEDALGLMDETIKEIQAKYKRQAGGQ